jgi:hypothetical protein
MLQVFDRQTAFKAVSVVVVAILGTQFALLFFEPRQRGWPMVTYPMYASARYDGDRFDDFKAYAVLKDGTKVEVDPGELGMPYWIFHKNVLLPLLSKDGDRERNGVARSFHALVQPASGDVPVSEARQGRSTAKLAPTIARYCNLSNGAMTRLEVLDSGVAISALGPVNLEPEVVAAMDVNCD